MASQNNAPTGWVGWIAFAGIMMILDGIFQFIIGLTAVLNPNYFVVTPTHLLLFNLTAWGWVQMILGALVVLIGASLFSGNMAARVMAVILVGLSAIANLGFISAYPFWSLIVITVDVLVIYALIVHGSELKESRS
jgi:hypothetical protein